MGDSFIVWGAISAGSEIFVVVVVDNYINSVLYQSMLTNNFSLVASRY